MTLFETILRRFDGDEAVARRYCKDQAQHYKKLSRKYPNLIQLAKGYKRAARSTNRVPEVRDEKRRAS